MRAPTPRLRQVFEHSTHFKVHRPGANPLVIAKSALSPKLTGRLRKFAQGGDVPDDDYAPGTAVPAGELSRNIQITDPGLTEEDIDRLRSPIIRAAGEEEMYPSGLVGPAVLNAEALIKKLQQEEAEATAEAPAKAEETPAEQAPSLAEQVPSLRMDFAPAKFKPSLMGAAQPAGAVAEPEISPTPVPAAAAPVAVAPAAPEALVVVPQPAAVTTPSVKAVKPTIALPEDVTEASPEAFQKALEMNKGVDPHLVASALVERVNPDLQGLKLDLPVRPEGLNENALQRFDRATAERAAALTKQAETDLESKKDMVRIAQQTEARLVEAAARSKAFADDLSKRAGQIEAKVSEGFHPRSFFGSMDTFQKIGSTLALAIGGFLSGSTGTPNYVYEAFTKAMDRDLEIQTKNYNSMVSQYTRLLGDAEDAKKLARADMMNLSAMQTKSAAARADLRSVGPQLQRLGAEMDMEAAKLRDDVRKKMADADISEIKAQTERELREAQAKRLAAQAAPKPVKVAGPSTAAESLAFRKARYLEGKRFQVPDPADPSKSITIEAQTPTVAAQKASELSQRVAGIMQLESFERWLAKNADKPVTPEALKEMQVKIAGIVENYPGTVRGGKGLVTVAQSKLLKPAITSTDLPIIKYMDTLGLTSTAMKSIREDANRAMRTSIQTAAAAGDPGAEEFLSKWTSEGYRGKSGYPAESQRSAPTADKARISFKDKSGNIRTALISRANLADAIKAGATEVP